MWLMLTSLFVLLISVFLYSWQKLTFQYWNKRGINGPRATLPFGNFMRLALLQKRLEPVLKHFYDEYPLEPVVGLYAGIKPVLLIRDPELVKQIMVKNRHIFQDRGITVAVDKSSLFFAEGALWRFLRRNLVSLFTTAKLKSMHLNVQKCVEKYLKMTENTISNNPIQEMSSITRRLSVIMSCSCLFGIDVTDKINNDTFLTMANKVSKIDWKIIMRLVFNIIIPGFDNICTLFGAKPKAYDVIDFFKSFLIDIKQERKQSSVKENDLVDLLKTLGDDQELIKITESDNTRETLDIEKLVASQAVTFFAGSVDSTANTIHFALYHLAFNQQMQDKACEEVKRIKNYYNGKITFEALQEMTYLAMIINETLRLYSSIGLVRVANEDFTFPGTNIKIDKDTTVLVSTFALHRDRKYFEQPSVFDPERFSSENKKNIPSSVYMPFGDGPRHCIGMRFGRMAILTGLAEFMTRYKVEPTEKTVRHFEMDRTDVHFKPLSGVWLKISKRGC